MSAIERAINNLRAKRNNVIPSKDLLSSGSTLLNLACSGRSCGAFAKGHYYWFVGDSASGKTFLALTCLAEASVNSEFDNYRLVYDNSENGALMNIEKFFGKRIADRLEPPYGTVENPKYSETLEDMYFAISDLIKEGRPFVFVEDSLDVLQSVADVKKFQQMKAARVSDRECSGSYGMAKAKVNSEMMRRIICGLRKTQSILIIISQTRDNVGFGRMFDPKRASGGRALKFYATLEIWSSVKESLKRTIMGKSRQVGVISKVRVKKNRIVGRDRTVEIPILHSYGIDDILSCILFLIQEGHWKGSKNRVSASEFDYTGSIDGLIQKIEDNGLERELRHIVTEVWQSIEEACKVKRKPRY